LTNFLEALPDSLRGVPASWIPASFAAPQRAVLSKLVPDGPRGVAPALEALATLVERLGGDATAIGDLIDGVRRLRDASLQPTAMNQPLSHFLYHAVALGPSVDMWTVWALPALWAARQATSTALASERPLRVTPRAYQRARGGAAGAGRAGPPGARTAPQPR